MTTAISQNMRAFLDMIAYSELGPELLKVSDNGYNVIVGSTATRPNLFKSYADHPRVVVQLSIHAPPSSKGKQAAAIIKSTAAGRYQILSRNYDVYRITLHLPNFGPQSQDAIALQMIKECRAIDDIECGRLATALSKCSSRWASFPSAGYGQHENSYIKLASAFSGAGGKIV